METEAPQNPDGTQSGVVKNIMDKFGFQVDMKIGVLIMIVIVIVGYFAYKKMYPASEGLEKGNDKKEKKSKDDKKDKTKKDIESLVDEIEEKQEENIRKK